jgi:SAM-dependent methyltransferase
MTPIDVPTSQTVAFIRSRCAPESAILEIGCGEGDVASALLDQGYQVIAVDSDPETIARVQARGIPAVCATWPELECDAARYRAGRRLSAGNLRGRGTTWSEGRYRTHWTPDCSVELTRHRSGIA